MPTIFAADSASFAEDTFDAFARAGDTTTSGLRNGAGAVAETTTFEDGGVVQSRA